MPDRARPLCTDMRQPKRAERKPSQRLSKAIRKELAEAADADWKAAEWAAYSKKVVNNASAQAARAVRAMRELEAAGSSSWRLPASVSKHDSRTAQRRTAYNFRTSRK